MDRLDFIRELFKFCNVKDDEFNTNLKIYDKALTVKKMIDWQKLFDLYIERAEKRLLPTPKVIKDLMPLAEIYKDTPHKVFFVFFESGMWLDFVYCPFGLDKNDLKEGLEKTYGKIKTTRLFPVGTTVMRGGKDGVFKVFPPQGETQILDLNKIEK